MAADQHQTPGISFEADLRMIREKRGITIEEIHRRAKVPVEVMAQFEKTGLTREPQFNEVYLRAFLRSYCEILRISPELTLQALEDTLRGRYDGSLAVEYLDVTRTDLPERPAPPPDRASDDTETEPREPPVANVEHRNEPLYRLDRRTPVPWRRVVLIVLCLGVLAVAVRVFSDWNVASYTEVEAPAGEIGATPEIRQDALGDTITVAIIAAEESLSPIRVQADNGVTNPFWVDEGDTLVVQGTEQFTVSGNLAAVRLLIDGEEYPLEVSVTERNLVLTRGHLEETLQQLP